MGARFARASTAIFIVNAKFFTKDELALEWQAKRDLCCAAIELNAPEDLRK
jgi:hypothetical protein